MPALTPRSRISPILETPSPYMMSNSTCLKGGASLFFTTLTRVVLPTTSSRSLIAPMRRMARRTEAENFSALPPVVVSGEPYITPIFIRIWLMKITMVLDLLIEAVSLRSAWLIRRGCAHLPLELGLRHQRRHRVDHEHVDRAGTHQRVADFQRLLAGVGLRDQELIDIDAELAGIDRVERVFGVDEGADAALLLALGHRMQRQRGLAGRLRPIDFNHPAARQPA